MRYTDNSINLLYSIAPFEDLTKIFGVTDD